MDAGVRLPCCASCGLNEHGPCSCAERVLTFANLASTRLLTRDRRELRDRARQASKDAARTGKRDEPIPVAESRGTIAIERRARRFTPLLIIYSVGRNPMGQRSRRLVGPGRAGPGTRYYI